MEADHISHHQFVGIIHMNSMSHWNWNIVCHTHVFAVPNCKECESYINSSHCEGVITRPNPNLHKVISKEKNIGTDLIMIIICTCFCESPNFSGCFKSSELENRLAKTAPALDISKRSS